MKRNKLGTFSRLAFFVCVVFLVGWLASAAYAQTPTPPDRQALLEQAQSSFNYGIELIGIGDPAGLRLSLGFFKEAEKRFRTLNDQDGVVNSLMRIGQVNKLIGEFQASKDAFEQAISEIEANPYLAAEFVEEKARSYVFLGGVYVVLGEPAEGMKAYQESLRLARLMNDKTAEATALNNIGLLHSDLGSVTPALDALKQALAIYESIGEDEGRAFSLNNIGKVYIEHAADLEESGNLEVLEKALDAINQGVTISLALCESGECPREVVGYLLNNLGKVFEMLGEPENAVTQYLQAVELAQLAGDKTLEAAILLNIGLISTDAGKFADAAKYAADSARISAAVGDKNTEALALRMMMEIAALQGNPRLAVFYGKQSINKFQELRNSVAEMGPETRSDYLKRVESAYRLLADLLVSDGRLPEAARVLAMLKEEEINASLRDASDLKSLTNRSDLSQNETEALKRFTSFSEKITSLGEEYGKLIEVRNRLPEGTGLNHEDQKRLDQLSSQLEDASAAFQVFLRELADEFGKRKDVVSDVEENTGLQADLKEWGNGVVALYTIAGDQRFRIILTTPDTQTAAKSEIKAADLNKKIARFREVIQNPALDPRPLGKELYDIIVKPIEPQLRGANAKTLIWSLDGSLRYLPLAALWDGEQYFGQKYENVVMTLASRTRMGETANPDWKVLGMGVTNAGSVTEPGGTRSIHFNALPAVGKELNAIISPAGLTEKSAGILPGTILLDDEFTAAAFKDRLGRGYQVIHIASHFNFTPGDLKKSFLLLGNGATLTLEEMKLSPQLRFRNIELLTLSACETAVGTSDENGKEIDSLGFIAQQNGAKAVLATLWSVSDGSTALLMSEFYKIRKQHPEITKSAAMRRAQNAMIEGKLNGETGFERTVGVRPINADPSAPLYKFDEKRPFAHPFYWSPFVLIGNWR